METLLRPGTDRGLTQLDWLDSRHAFSFGQYRDPQWRGYHGLRVLNEDVVAPGRGFGPHAHRDAEILSFVLDGALLHEDSEGGRATLLAGDVQAMSAGPGVVHAEWNASDREAVRFVQVWLAPDRPVAVPSFVHARPAWRERGGLVRIASPDPQDGSLPLAADASVYAARLRPGDGFEHALAANRVAWVQVLGGSVRVAGRSLETGDGIGIEEGDRVCSIAHEAAEILLFDLARTHRTLERNHRGATSDEEEKTWDA